MKNQTYTKMLTNEIKTKFQSAQKIILAKMKLKIGLWLVESRHKNKYPFTNNKTKPPWNYNNNTQYNTNAKNRKKSKNQSLEREKDTTSNDLSITTPSFTNIKQIQNKVDELFKKL